MNLKLELKKEVNNLDNYLKHNFYWKNMFFSENNMYFINSNYKEISVLSKKNLDVIFNEKILNTNEVHIVKSEIFLIDNKSYLFYVKFLKLQNIQIMGELSYTLILVNLETLEKKEYKTSEISNDKFVFDKKRKNIIYALEQIDENDYAHMNLIIFNVEKWCEIKRKKIYYKEENNEKLINFEDTSIHLEDICISNNGDTLVLTTFDEVTIIINLDNLEIIKYLFDSGLKITFSNDDKYIIFGTKRDNLALFYDTTNWELFYKITIPVDEDDYLDYYFQYEYRINNKGLNVTYNNKYLVIETWNPNCILFYDIKKKKLRKKITNSNNFYHFNLYVSKTENILAYQDYESNSLKIYELTE
ncbi:MAG: hypothetical protein U0457_13845 [Candidatus Sericytochromatia bacterium]